MLEEISAAVISYCDLPDEIQEEFDEFPCDVYVMREITPIEEQEQYDNDFLFENWVINKYPQLEGREVLVHIDY